MKNKKKISLYQNRVGFWFILSSMVVWNPLFAQNPTTNSNIQPKFDRMEGITWPTVFELVKIPSSIDDSIQNAYFYKSTNKNPQPLIVSLHSWSGDYLQEDPMAKICLENNVNYIHPDFRGSNNKPEACCSELAMNDIDEAITYALANSIVSPSAIYVVGVSGGGFAALNLFNLTKHKIDKFSVWVPISDLEAWFYESSIRKNKYANDILVCTYSQEGKLNIEEARKRSPFYNAIPVGKLDDVELFIHTGVFDGIQGSVPITHSINFYNQLLKTDGCTTDSLFVSPTETLHLIEKGTTLGKYGKLGERDILLKKEYKKAILFVFDGNHEMLPEVAFDELLK